MRLSIVVTLYRSAPFIAEFYRRSLEAANCLTNNFEIVFVNDGSPDDSLDIVVQLHRQDTRVVVVDLSRNFGHHRAMMAGLQHAKGDLVFLLDADLEENPADLATFYETMRREACDVVYGVQAKRRGGLFERVSGNLFYWLLRNIGELPIPQNLTTMRLMTRRYVNSLLEHREREMIISGLWLLTGYKQVAEKVTKQPRTHKTNYKFGTRIKFAVDHITSFSSGLLYKVFYLGVSIFALSFLVMIYYSVRYFMTQSPVAGFTSIVASIWMFGGLQTLLIGLVGTYIAHIFRETKNRPYVIVRELYRRNEMSSEQEVEDVIDGHKALRRH
jgi:putative glycosyltransferase